MQMVYPQISCDSKTFKDMKTSFIVQNSLGEHCLTEYDMKDIFMTNHSEKNIMETNMVALNKKCI